MRVTDWLHDAWMALPDGTVGGLVGAGTLLVMVWQTHHNRRQAQAAERANELTKQELARTTAQTRANQSELLAVLETVQELYRRIEVQQQAIDECHQARDAEQAQRVALEAQLYSERISARARLHTVSEEMRAFREEYRYLSELYVALSQGWTYSVTAKTVGASEQG